jgi:F-type H+-transporting ATPase subunit epsilon
MGKLAVSLVTPGRQVARVEVDMVTAPSVMGEVGILPDHRALLADLEEGPVMLKAGQSTEVYAVSGGFLEVDRNHVTLLAETAEHTSEIDAERSLQALRDSEAMMKKLDVTDPEYQEQCARNRRARVRLAAVGKKPS